MAKKKKVKDFPKVKIKLGKKLKKTAATDTRIETKKVVIVEQLRVNDGCVSSYRGLSLEELCRQLGHYNINVRRDSVIGLRQLLSLHPEFVPKYLHILIPTVGRLIACDKSDSSFHSQLRALVELLCKTDASAISSHFTLLMMHTLRALTHLRKSVRFYALTILTLLMRTYPNLSQNNIDLFDSFVELLNSKSILTNKKLLLDAIATFLRVFRVEEPAIVGPLRVAYFSVRNGQSTQIDLTPISESRIDFCVLGSQPQQFKSPLHSPEKFLLLLSGIFSFFIICASEESSPYEKEWIEIFTSLDKFEFRLNRNTDTLLQSLSQIRMTFTAAQMDEFRKVSSGVALMLKKGCLCQRIHKLLQSITQSGK
ncbi:unnamed protein product [Thelazia callipaeda]|uniref:Ipi1_N domain-containing protein n=1 Tax=Thelazia callipaeda TaxID=103827 RepID=A0A0N5CKE5_THECL|nr:unnamed protein product [Thelazia callipaeda]